jgi:putative ABC transport system ATP-binding protein
MMTGSSRSQPPEWAAGSRIRENGVESVFLEQIESMSTMSPPATLARSIEATSDLAAGLVYLAARSGLDCELRVAERLVTDAARCWPGTVERQWWKWLQVAGRSLSLELRVADITARDLQTLVRSGVAVLSSPVDGVPVVVEQSGRRGLQRRRLDGQPWSGSDTPSSASERVLMVEAPHYPHGGHGHGHARPLHLLWGILAPETKDIATVCVLSAVAGLLLISVPVTAQQLVRAVTFASFYQPIVVLSLLLLGLLGFMAALTALQSYVAEVIQRRLFVRTATTLSRHLPRTASAAWHGAYPREIVNRFLDIAIIQKVLAGLLVDGIGVVLATLIGMSVMAFYHPYLLGYDVVLLVLLAGIFFGFGRSGVTSAIRESRVKYQTLSWLEDVAGAPGLFRTGGVELLATQRTDALCAAYLTARRQHFRVLLRQIVLILALQAIATTSLLGLGGYLVLREQLTLGQLVAAELIVANIVASFAKLGKHLEGWYDLLAAVDKLSHVTDLDLEPSEGLLGIPRVGPGAVGVEGLGGHPGILEIAAGECVAMSGWGEVVTDQLAADLEGRAPQDDCRVTLDGVDVVDLRPDVLRTHVAVLRHPEFFTGAIAENVHLHRPEVSEASMLSLLDRLGLPERLHRRGLTVTSPMLPHGAPLTHSEQALLVLARGLVANPRVLMIDHLLDGLPDQELDCVARVLTGFSKTTTIIVATERSRLAEQCARCIVPPGSSRTLED